MSGLSYQISITEEGVSSIFIHDCTGRYSYKNEGGFGKPNFELKDIKSSFLYITVPHATEPVKIDVTGVFPNKEENGYEILPFMLGLPNNEITSGEYKVKAEISGTDKNGVEWIRTVLIAKVFINQVVCCVDKMQKIVDKDAFKDEKQKLAIELSNLIESVKHGVDCELNSTVVETIEYIRAQCQCCGC
jgi:hypothetical protein